MIITGILLFLFVYYIITLSDLECDYINAQQCCSKLNMWNLPAAVGQALVTAVFLLHGWLLLFTLNLPMASWSAYQIIKIPSGNIGLFDPMEIHNRGQLKAHMRDVLVKMAFYLLTFFFYLYCMIVSMLKTDPSPHQVYGDFDEF